VSPDVIFDVLRGIACAMVLGALISGLGILALKWGERRKRNGV
jgi:hypothetical protein